MIALRTSTLNKLSFRLILPEKELVVACQLQSRRRWSSVAGADDGFTRGMEVIVSAVITAVLLGEVVPRLIESGVLPKGYLTLLIAVSLFSTVSVVGKSKSWSLGYLVGFCIGVVIALPIFAQTRFFGPVDITLYLIVVIAALLLRARTKSF
jgi:hypothetical protein